ncbi:MAG: CapA family protein [Candidatus Moranbacteria bacterium]|nr:CapA family protein [Candidatus Moranbacteria bacterium]
MKKIVSIVSFFIVLISVFVFVFTFRVKLTGVFGLKESGLQEIQEVAPRKASVLFVGDMMFDRWIRQVTERKGIDFVLGGVDRVLEKNDLVVGNLEGPITGNESVSVGTEFGSRENYIFTFPPETASNLQKKNIRLVSLGNNHIWNFGTDGLAETKKHLSNAGVEFFGDTGEDGERFVVREINGIKIAFVNFNQFARKGRENVMGDLEAVKSLKPDFVVVYAHWGKEYEGRPEEETVALARAFVDDGADAVIGSHPHVVQTKEEYKEKMIYYSLGNFVFDQYFEDETQRGMIVEVEFDSSGKLNFQEHDTEMGPSGQTSLLYRL